MLAVIFNIFLGSIWVSPKWVKSNERKKKEEGRKVSGQLCPTLTTATTGGARKPGPINISWLPEAVPLTLLRLSSFFLEVVFHLEFF